MEDAKVVVLENRLADVYEERGKLLLLKDKNEGEALGPAVVQAGTFGTARTIEAKDSTILIVPVLERDIWTTDSADQRPWVF